MSPAADKLLALLAEGYRIEVEDHGGWDTSSVHVRKYAPSAPKGPELRQAASELAALGYLDTAANGSGNAWISEKGRAAVPSPSGSTKSDLPPTLERG